jgi:RHS repeat-associated protein
MAPGPFFTSSIEMVCAAYNMTKRPCRVVSRSASMHRLARTRSIRSAIETPDPNVPTVALKCKYDAWNRLVEVRNYAGKLVAEYRYDTFGRRTKKVRYTNGQVAGTELFYYSPDWRLLEKWRRNGPGGDITGEYQYVWGLRGPDELLQRRNLEFALDLTPIQDETFNATALVDTAGNVLERYRYLPRGVHFLDPSGSPIAGSQFDWSVLFGGYYYDDETGLYHVRRRTYHPTLGTWLQPDPQGYADGPNLYLYGRGSPVTFVDPSGESATVIGGFAGGVIGFFAGGFTGRGFWDWDRAWAGAGSGALIGAAVGFAIDTFGAGTPLSAALIGAGLGGGVSSAFGGGLLTSRNPTDWVGWSRGGLTGVASGAASGAVSGWIAALISAGAASGAFTGAVSAFVGDYVGQSLALDLGWQKQFNLSQSGLSTLLGFAIGGVAAAASAKGGVVKPSGTVDEVLQARYLSIAESPEMARTLSRYNRIARILQLKKGSLDEIVEALRNDITFRRVGHLRSAIFSPGQHPGATRFWLQGNPVAGYGARVARHELLHLGAALRGQSNSILHELAVVAAATPENLLPLGALIVGAGGAAWYMNK